MQDFASMIGFDINIFIPTDSISIFATLPTITMAEPPKKCGAVERRGKESRWT